MSGPNGINKALEELHGTNSSRDTVLCVDDDPGMRRLLATIMNRVVPELKVELASGYEEAIDKVSGELVRHVALVLTDTEMPPGKTGLKLAEALRGKSASKEILKDMRRVPVVINSGNSNYASPDNHDGLVMQALIDNDVADAFLSKPYMVDDVREAALTAINRIKEASARNN